MKQETPLPTPTVYPNTSHTCGLSLSLSFSRLYVFVSYNFPLGALARPAAAAAEEDSLQMFCVYA